ncbi:dihydrolipoyllysine-residue succinyltransferase [Candidatus Aerophobetes bacterium]|uniref:Dihydrolipoyllysine-residue succinyltransferase n=1 Tax=Aerophobetes bacterium TaxID=2030807 RepID=A0A2A4WZC4_UNCAE|nr:MAG: dihydrolipoyllysine-residue succinyltransferase [Candidatus Aerophobetes bacterium]
MKVEIKVPEAGESVTEATVAELFCKNGDFVEKEAELLEVETDKVNQVIHAPEAGTIHLDVKVDDIVKPLQVIGFVDTSGATKEESKAPVEEKSGVQEEQKPSSAQPAKEEKTSSDQSARLFAKDKDFTAVDKKEPEPKPVSPSLEKPAIKEEKKSSSSEQEYTKTRMSSLRKTIAKRLVEVKNQTAMLTTFNEVDMSFVMGLRKKEQESFVKRHGIKLGFMSFFVKAVTESLKQSPSVHSFIDEGYILTPSAYHIGVAVSTEKGLMVPVIRDCDKLSFAGIEKGIAQMAKSAREGKISMDDLKGGSFTITNGGTFGSMLSTPILNPPQSAILGMHNIVKRVVVIDDKIEIRPMMYLALSYDHRVIDGKESVSFLVKVKEILENPEKLMFEQE